MAETGAPVRTEAIQLGGFDNGPRLGVWWRPSGRAPRGAVLCVQPLGAERAAARRTLALQAWRLAARGWAVLMPDLFGTGDSPGEPGDATLEGWRSDLLRAAMTARQGHDGPNVVWGVRHGALLAADAAVALDQLVDAYLFWQAPDSGEDIAIDTGEGGVVSRSLLADLRELHMRPPPLAGQGTPVAALFLELQQDGPRAAGISAPTCALTEDWLEAGYLATPRSVHAGAFWTPRLVARAPGAPPPRATEPTDACIATEEFLEALG